MSTRAKLAGFALVVAAGFAAGLGVGAATDGPDAPAPTHQEQRRP